MGGVIRFCRDEERRRRVGFRSANDITQFLSRCSVDSYEYIRKQELAAEEDNGGVEDEDADNSVDLTVASIHTVRSGIQKLATSSWRARCARSWTKLIVNSQHVLNVVNCVSLPPHLFSRDSVKDRNVRFSSAPFLNISNYLLDMMEILDVVEGAAGGGEDHHGHNHHHGHGATTANNNETAITNATASQHVNFEEQQEAIANSNLVDNVPVVDDNGIDKTTIDVDFVCNFVLYGASEGMQA